MASIDEDAELARVEAELANGGENPEAKAQAEAEALRLQQEEANKNVDVEAEAARVAAEEAARAEAEAKAGEEASGRFRLKGKLAALAQLTKDGMSEEEAVARVYGKPEPAKAVETGPDPIIALEKEKAEIEAKLKSVADENGLFTPELLAALDRKAEIKELIAEEKRGKARAERQAKAEQVQTEQQKFDAGWTKSEEWAKARYDDATNPNSALSKAVANEIDEIAGDPSHYLYGNPQIPQLLFAKHAADLGIAPKAKATATQVIRPASGGAKTVPTPVQNLATIQADFQAKQAQAVAAGDDDALADLAEMELSMIATGKATKPDRRQTMRVA